MSRARSAGRPAALAALVAASWLAACADAGAQQKSAAAKPATAVQATTPAKRPGGSDNSGKPIEIVSDRLTVEQNSQIATFLGNVDAVQGDMSLRADELRVYYITDEQRQAGGSDQSIRRIEAEGHVLVTTPTETAAGDSGIYDPITRKVVLEGNVVLTRGDNVVRGARLDSDLASGISTVTAAPVAKGSTAPGKRNQRVRALFVPEQNEPGQADQPSRKGR
jgi:lipopolysaccharide export system protein LptA